MRKRLIICFLLLSMLLCACQSVPPETGDAGLITFPGTHWNMTPEELMTALAIPETAVTVYLDEPRTADNQVGTYQIGVDGMELYGYPATVGFTFCAYTDDAPLGLSQVIVVYQDNADTEAIRQALGAELGDPTGSHNTYPYVYWDSAKRLRDYMSEDAVETVRSNYLDNPNLPNGEELLNNFLATPAVRLFWVNEPEIDLLSPPVSAGSNALCYTGSVTEMMQRYADAPAE